MAKLCENCGKKNNPFAGDVFFLNDEKILCYKCAQYIRDDINNLYYVKTQEEFDDLKTKIISTSNKQYNELITADILARIGKIYQGLRFERDTSNVGPFENQDLVYTIDGVRGRHIDIYTNKVVITTEATIGSLITRNATDGEKTIYYSDCIGVQFKQAGFTIGYLQLETASSNGNHKNSNFFDENSFTYDTTVISNEKMLEVINYIKSRIDVVKTGKNTVPVPTNNNNTSVADELLKLKQLLDMGVLTQEEFDAQKNKLLNT